MWSHLYICLSCYLFVSHLLPQEVVGIIAVSILSIWYVWLQRSSHIPRSCQVPVWKPICANSRLIIGLLTSEFDTLFLFHISSGCLRLLTMLRGWSSICLGEKAYASVLYRIAYGRSQTLKQTASPTTPPPHHQRPVMETMRTSSESNKTHCILTHVYIHLYYCTIAITDM